MKSTSKELNTLTYETARQKIIIQAKSLRVFGVKLASRDAQVQLIYYCGFQLKSTQHRRPTKRIWHIASEEILDSGMVDGFKFEGNQVFWFDINYKANIVEESYSSFPLSDFIDPRSCNGVAQKPIPTVTTKPTPIVTTTETPIVTTTETPIVEP